MGKVIPECSGEFPTLRTKFALASRPHSSTPSRKCNGSMDVITKIHALLNTVGVPAILEDPDALATMSDDHRDMLHEARDLASTAVEEKPEDEQLIDLLYMSHMTLSTSQYLYSVLSADEPAAVPTPAELNKAWSGRPLMKYDKNALKDMLVPTTTLDTLTQVGLPDEAEPYLSFEPTLKRLAEAEELDGEDEDYDRYFQAYWLLGYTEDDDALCIDERADGVVALLQRDWGFFAMQYVNASVGHLLQTMQAYDDMLKSVDPQTAAESFPNIQVPDEARVAFLARVSAFDPGAMAEGAFWYEELSLLEQGGEEDDDQE